MRDLRDVTGLMGSSFHGLICQRLHDLKCHVNRLTLFVTTRLDIGTVRSTVKCFGFLQMRCFSGGQMVLRLTRLCQAINSTPFPHPLVWRGVGRHTLAKVAEREAQVAYCQ